MAGWSAFPLTPTDVICYVAGTLRMPVARFAGAVALGKAALVAFYVWATGSLVEWWTGLLFGFVYNSQLWNTRFERRISPGNLGDVLARVRYRNDSFVVERNGARGARCRRSRRRRPPPRWVRRSMPG